MVTPFTKYKLKTSLTRVYMNATFEPYLTEILKKPIPCLKVKIRIHLHSVRLHGISLRLTFFSCLDAVGTKIDWKRYIYYYYHYNFFFIFNNDNPRPPLPQRPNFILHCRELGGKFESIRRPHFCHKRGMPINTIFQLLYFV